MPKHRAHIRSIIHRNNALSQLAKQAQHLSIIDKVVKNHLDASLRAHCKVANYRENTLCLHVDSPVWATRLRFALPMLTTQLQQTYEFKHLQEINVHLSKHIPSHTHEKRRIKLKLSKETAEQLDCLADCVTDEKLSGALKRLAKHHQK